MRSHGSGVACYRGQRLPAGPCESCRRGNAKRNARANARYLRSAKGMLARIRIGARRRAAA